MSYGRNAKEDQSNFLKRFLRFFISARTALSSSFKSMLKSSIRIKTPNKERTGLFISINQHLISAEMQTN